MASTNKTTHYELSQYIGTDKPTYLGDYNTDMSKIDSGIYGAQADATSALNQSSIASDTANSAIGAIGTLSNLTTTEKSNLVGAINEVNNGSSAVGNLSNLTTTNKSNLVGAINEVNSVASTNGLKIGTLSNLTTTEKSNLVGAVNEVNTNLKNFNLTNITKFTTTSELTVTNTTVQNVNLTLAKNNDDSLFKFYGSIQFQNSSGAVDIIVPTSIDGVDEEYEIYPMGWVGKSVPTNSNGSPYFNAFVQTDGKIRIHYWAGTNTDSISLFAIPFLIFNKNFGDYDPSNNS